MVDNALAWIGLVGGAGLGTKMLHVLIQTRDGVRDHMRDVGTKEPPTGLFKEVLSLKEVTDEHTEHLLRMGVERRKKKRDEN